MEECSVLIETTKSAEDKTSRWFDLPIDYELFRDLLGGKLTVAIIKLQKLNIEMLNCYQLYLLIMRHTACTQNGRKENRRKSSSIYYGTRPHRCNNGRI